MSIVTTIKSSLFTKVKKTMTKRMYELYYKENADAPQAMGEYEAVLGKAYKHLDACRFIDKGWPCPTCPSCCFRGKDYDDMMQVMNFAQKWAEEHPDQAKKLMSPKAVHKH